MTDPARKEDDSLNRTPTIPTPLAVRERRRRAVGWQSKDVLRTAALVMAMYVILRLLWFANALFLTAFVGILFGLAVSSGVDHLTRWRIPRGIGAALVVLSFLGLLVGFGAWVAPTIRAQSVELRHRLPEAVDRLDAWVNRHNSGLMGSLLGPPSTPSVRRDSTTPVSAATTAPDTTSASPLRDRLGKQMSGATRYLFPFLSSTLAALGGVLIIIFLAIYIGADPEMYHRGLMQLFPVRARRRAGEVLSAIATALRRWLVTQLIAMVVIGTVTTIVLLLLGVKAAFALGILAGLFEFIPTIGPILSALPAIAMGFLDSPEKALYVALAFWAIQFTENHLLIPLLMKGGVDAPPALTILSQALMAILFGFVGLLCAVPLLAAVLVAIKMLYVEGVVGERVSVANENPVRDATLA